MTAFAMVAAPTTPGSVLVSSSSSTGTRSSARKKIAQSPSIARRLRLGRQVEVLRRFVRQRPADVGLRPLHMELVRSVGGCGERAVERALIFGLARRQRRRDVLLLERGEIARVLGPHYRELALQRAHPADEIRGELPVAATRRVRAFPPALADRSHDLAGTRQELGDLLEREIAALRARDLCVL